MASYDFMTAREVEEQYGIDLVTAETIRAGLIEVTRHMFRALNRGAFSNVVRDLLDFGVCLHMIGDEGIDMVSITEGCTHFAFTQPHMTNFVIDEWGLDNLGPGDTLICNDPFRGSIHMPDVNLFRPVFWNGKPLFVLSDASHLLDIGGPVPGGFNNTATEVYAEGLRIPPMLITSGDKPVRSTIALVLENSRTPVQNLGDLRALFGTMRVGEEQVLALLGRYGEEAVLAAARYAVDLAERRLRRVIDQVPDGIYTAEEWLDDDGMTDEPIRLHASARVAGSQIEIDFSGTDRQPLGSLCTCWEETNRILLGPKMILDPNHPMNTGLFRPIHVVAPPGSAIMGLPPTSSSQHADVATHIASLSLKLFGQMIPGREVASDAGTTMSCAIGGVDHRPGSDGSPFGLICAEGIGWGGTATQDGISFCSSPIYGILSSVIEVMERDGPLALRSWNLAMDGAGAGKFRGGFSNCALLECVHGSISITLVLDSGRFVREGMSGGGAGMTTYVYKVRKNPDNSIPMVNGIIPLDHLEPVAGIFDAEGQPSPERGIWAQGTLEKTVKLTGFELKQGEAIWVVCAGGGGYGSPLERDPELVRSDVWNERISLSAARRIYGVAIDDDGLSVDDEQTVALRDRLAAEQQRGDWQVPVSIFAPWPTSNAELLASDAAGASRVAVAEPIGEGRLSGNGENS